MINDFFIGYGMPQGTFSSLREFTLCRTPTCFYLVPVRKYKILNQVQDDGLCKLLVNRHAGLDPASHF